MAKAYDNKLREKIRLEFAKHRNKGHSIATSSQRAGISPSTLLCLEQRRWVDEVVKEPVQKTGKKKIHSHALPPDRQTDRNIANQSSVV